MPSDFSKFQVNECKEVEYLSPKTVCPTCIPDPQAEEINWIAQSEPYFDARTCEYVSVYRISLSEVTSLDEDFGTLEEIAEFYKKEAIRHLIRHYNKLENDYTVCAFGGCLSAEEFETYKEVFNEFFNIMADNYEEIINKYSLASLVSSASVGTTGILGILKAFKILKVSNFVSGVPADLFKLFSNPGTGVVLSALISIITLIASAIQIQEFFADLSEDFPIDDFVDDLANLVGADILEGLERLRDIYGEIHPYALEWTAEIPPNGYILDDSNNIKIKVTVPAFNFDLIPQASDDNTDEPDSENTSSFPDEIILKDSVIFAQKMNLLAGMNVFAYSYEFFRVIEKGRLLYRDGTTYETFSLLSTIDLTEEFFEELEKFLAVNSFKFSYQFDFNINKDIAEEVKIILDNSDPNNPLKIKQVFAKSPYCDFVELTVSKNSSNIFKSYPTVINFLTQLEAINSRMLAGEKIEWLDFCLDYVYPPLKVDYGRNTRVEDVDIIECLGDPADWAAENLIKPLSSFFSQLSFNLQKKICDKDFDVISKSDPLNFNYTEEEIQRIAAEKAEERRESIEQTKKGQRDKRVQRLKDAKILVENPSNTTSGSYKIGDTTYYRDTAANIQSATDLWRELEADGGITEADLQQNIEKALEDEKKKIADGLRNKENNPWYQVYMQRFFDEIQIDDDISDLFRKKAKDPLTFEKVLSFVGLCGMNRMTGKAISCFAQGLSLQDFQNKIIKNFLKKMPLDNWSTLLAFLPADAIVKIEQQILEDFGESIEPPWLSEPSYQRIKSPSERRKDREAKASFLISRYKKIDKDLNAEMRKKYFGELEDHKLVKQGIIFKPKGQYTDAELKKFANINDKYSRLKEDKIGNLDLTKTANLIVDAYVDALINQVESNVLLQSLRQLPGSEIVLGTLNLLLVDDCEGREFKELSEMIEGFVPDEGFIKSFSIDYCNPIKNPISFNPPKLRGASDLFKVLFKIVGDTGKRVVLTLLRNIVLSLLKFVEGLICKGLEALGQAALAGLTGNPMDDIFKEVFCPDLSDQEAHEQLNDLLNKVGISDRAGPNAPADIAACLGNAIAGSVTKNQLIEMMIGSNTPQFVLQNVATAINLNCPELAGVLGTPSQIGGFFGNLGTSLPPDTVLGLQEALATEPDEIITDTICFTSEELEEYQAALASTYDNLGLPGDEIVDQQYTDNLNNLDEVLNYETAVDDALNDLYNTNPTDGKENCEDFNVISNFGGSLAPLPAELVEIENETSRLLFKQFEFFYMLDLIGSDSALLSRILSDTQGITFSRHGFLEENFLFGAFYHNTPQEAAEKQSLLDAINPFNLISDRGYFPETIGKYLNSQIAVNRSFEEADFYNYKIIFTPIEGEDLSNFVYYTHKANESNLDYSINYSDRAGDYYYFGSFDVNVNTTIPQEISHHLDSDVNIPLRERLYNAVLNYSLRDFDNYLKPNPKGYYTTCSKFFDEVSSLIFSEDSKGFTYGYTEDPLTTEDMTYVAPDGSEYNFEEEEQVLGRSATNNPRVHFLDPSVYGGTYKRPPVFVEPISYDGWLDAAKIMVPDLEDCEPRKQNILRISEIYSYANLVKNSERFDERLGEFDNLKCFEEKPFDKVATNATKGGLAAATKLAIRTIVIENFILSLPAFMNLKYNDLNYDSSYSQFVVKKFKDRVMKTNTFLPGKIQKENFYLLLLEQAVVDYQRLIDSGSVFPSDQINEALEKISAAERNFTKIAFNLNKINGEDRVPPITLDYVENFDFENYDRKSFIIYALKYQQIKEKLFTNNDRHKVGANPALFFMPRSIHLDAKIFMIRMVQKECELILAEMINREVKETFDFFFQTFEPEISNIKTFMLTNKNLFSNTQLENIGKTSYEEKKANGETVILGDVPSVLTNTDNSSPFTLDSNEQEFIIEKYIRVYEKENSIEEVANRDAALKGVTSIEEFDSFIQTLATTNPDTYISDIFGNAEFTYSVTLQDLLDNNITLDILNTNSVSITPQQITVISGYSQNVSSEILSSTIIVNQEIIEQMEGEFVPTGYTGQVGLKYGIRICHKPKFGDIDNTVTFNQENIDFAKHEKSYLYNINNFPSVDSYGFPICSAELEIMDHKLSDFSLLSGKYKYDLDCMLRKLTETEEFNLFFGDVINLNCVPGLFAIYTNLFFINSIGPEDGWEQDTDFWTDAFGVLARYNSQDNEYFDRSFKYIRKIFSTLYLTKDADNTEQSGDILSQDLALNQLAAGNLKISYAKTVRDRLKKPNPFAKRHRHYKQNPFDKDGKQCENPYAKIFS